MKPEVLKIIKDCNLSKSFINKLKRDYYFKDGYRIKIPVNKYLGQSYVQKLESELILAWYAQRQENRRRLLAEALDKKFAK